MSSPILKTNNIFNFYNGLIKARVVKGGAFGGRKVQIGDDKKNLLTMNQIVRHFEKLSKELSKDENLIDSRDVKDALDTLKVIRKLDKKLPLAEQTKLERILAPIAKLIGNIIDTIKHGGVSREFAYKREKSKYKKLKGGSKI